MSNDYSNPVKKCDMVMKGGITSGVVYPLAICEIAKKFRFKNIGGTSAGAIAAAATAAAEYSRQKDGNRKEGGFADLETLPKILARDLFHLFQPQAKTKKIFSILEAGLAQSKMKILNILFRSIVNFPFATLLGILPGGILAIMAIRSASGFLFWWSLLSAVLLILVGFVLAILLTAGIYALKRIPNNFYGICSGMPGSKKEKVGALTPWLTEYLDKLAGIDGREYPLTFGDLWGAEHSEDEANECDINLEMLTTNLTTGESYRLPFDNRKYFFIPEEFERVFPKKVVDWMKNNPARLERDPTVGTAYRPLPEPKNLPVVVATRLSLSFPILLSAIPLYEFDYDPDPDIEGEKPEPVQCWFSDGGIISNMPVHFFDKPLPRWPTFAIDLQSVKTSLDSDQSRNIWIPGRNVGGIRAGWSRINSPGGSIIEFIGMIVSTMQNWLDNAQMRLPGYRDRIVHIKIDSTKEGGLNLKMPEEAIGVLVERGKHAGAKLVERFSSDDPVLPPEQDKGKSGWVAHPWENHRWARFRSIMSLLEGFLLDYYQGYKNPEPGDEPLGEIMKKPNTYEWKRNKQRDFASELTKELLKFIEKWEKEDQSFSEGAPKPTPVLHVTPKT